MSVPCKIQTHNKLINHTLKCCLFYLSGLIVIKYYKGKKESTPILDVKTESSVV